MDIDFSLFQHINNLAGQYAWLDALMIFLSQYLGYVLVAIVLLFLLLNYKKYLLMVVSGLTAAMAARLGVVELIRLFFPRARPFVENNVNLLVSEVQQPAFPSGHAAFFFALSTVVYFYNKKAGIVFFVASFLISVARVFVGLHWPLDIVAGALVGVSVGYSIIFLSRRLLRSEHGIEDNRSASSSSAGV